MVYEIRKYDMKGATFYTKKERPDMYEVNGKFYENGCSKEAFKSNLWSYTTNPNKGAFSAYETLLPYFADVTEDIAPYYKIEPKTYRNCQLMTEKHGGYYQFWHEETKQVLRIAINSHYYQPIN